MSEVTVTVPAPPEQGIASEDAVAEEVRVACDGACGGFIPPEMLDDDEYDASAYTTEDGREGHVCSPTCAAKFEAGETLEPAAHLGPEPDPADEVPLDNSDDWPDDVPRSEPERVEGERY